MTATVGVRLLALPLLVAAVVTPRLSSPAAAADAVTVPVSDCWSGDNGDADLTGLTLGDTTVDASGGDAVLHVEATVSDTGGPGPASGIQAVVVYSSPDVSTVHTADASARLRPTPAGTWAGDLVIARGSTPGRWLIREVDVFDRVDHQRQIVTRDLVAMGAAYSFTVVGPADAQRPVLEALTVTPGRVEGASFPLRVTVRARASDDLAGVKEMQVSAQHGEGGSYRRADLRRIPSGHGASPSSSTRTSPV
jgi:hypothetical protein